MCTSTEHDLLENYVIFPAVLKMFTVIKKSSSPSHHGTSNQARIPLTCQQPIQISTLSQILLEGDFSVLKVEMRPSTKKIKYLRSAVDYSPMHDHRTYFIMLLSWPKIRNDYIEGTPANIKQLNVS